MSLNATLLVQMLCFITFVAITMKFIWPPITEIMNKRRQEIADGLAAAENGRKALELSQHKAKEIIDDAKAQASQIIEQANTRYNRIVEQSKNRARVESDKLLHAAKEEVAQLYISAKADLMGNISQMIVAGAKRILQKEIDIASNDALIKEFLKEEA